MIITKGPEEWSFLVFETEFSNFRNYSFPLLELEFRAFGTKVSRRETISFKAGNTLFHTVKQNISRLETNNLVIALTKLCTVSVLQDYNTICRSFSSSTTAIIPSTCARASIRPWKEYPGL